MNESSDIFYIQEKKRKGEKERERERLADKRLKRLKM